MRHRTGYGYTPPRPCFTDRNGRPTINDFPLVPAIQSGSLSRANEVSRGAETPQSEIQQPLAQPNPPQVRPPVPPARETIIPLTPIEGVPDESSVDESSDVEARAAALLAQLYATHEDEELAPIPPRRTRKKTRTRSKRRSRRSKPAEPAAELGPRGHHERHCSVCNHPDRDAIEEEFLHWYSPTLTGNHFGVGWQAIYRHAHATGLYTSRERNLRSALGYIVEKACRIMPTADGVLRAIRAYSCLNRDGQWTELPTNVIVSSGSQLAAPKAIAAAAITVSVPQPALPVDATATPERSSELLENENK